jgi:hypothetical protein
LGATGAAVESDGLVAAVVGFDGCCDSADGEVGLVGWLVHGLIVVVDVHLHVALKASACMFML